jgi:hypothetical protein
MIHRVNMDVFLNHPVPERTDTYVPVTNAQIYDLITQQAETRGMKLTGKGFRANPSRTEFMGLLTFDNPDSGLSKMIGFRNSTNKAWSVGLVAGAMVVVCANGMISGEVMNMRKHTGSVLEDLNEMVVNTFDHLTPKFNTLKSKMELMKEVEIYRPTALELIGQLFFTEKLISTTQMSILREKIDTDKHFAFPKDVDIPFPVWNLYNIITESLKHGTPSGYFGAHIELDKIFESRFNPMGDPDVGEVVEYEEVVSNEA